MLLRGPPFSGLVTKPLKRSSQRWRKWRDPWQPFPNIRWTRKRHRRFTANLSFLTPHHSPIGGKMPEPYSLTLVQMMALIARKRLSPVDLMESILKRIDTVEPRVLAWVTLDRESVLQEARRQGKRNIPGQNTRAASWHPYWGERYLLHRGNEDRLRLESVRGLRPRVRFQRRSAAEKSRRDHSGQNGHYGICPRRTRSHPQSLEPGPHPRRVEQRLGGRGGDGNVPGGSGFTDGRVGPAAGSSAEW